LQFVFYHIELLIRELKGLFNQVNVLILHRRNVLKKFNPIYAD
jgi:hypothetical protein